MNLISMSVWGEQPMYWEGALANARLYQSIYPGWHLRIYTDTENEFTKNISDCGAEIRLMENLGGVHGMFWRFLPASDPEVDAVIVRDTDSRLNVREAAAVAAWLESGKAAHVMRDHPHHAPWPMLGGMWGIRGGVVPDMANKIAAWGKWAAKVDDMYFLKAVIWPLIADDCVQHGYGGEPFPPHGPCDEFVGKTHGTFKRKGSIAAGKRTRPKWWQFRAKKFEKARAAANRALAANPNDLIAWRKLGDVLLGLKQYQKAVACYERVLAFEPDDRAIADKYAAATTLLKQKR